MPAPRPVGGQSRRCRSFRRLKASSLIFVVGTRRVRQFAIKGFAIAQAAAQEFRPWRHGDVGRDALGKQSPEIRMMPAQIVAGAVAVRANTGAQALCFEEQLLAVHPVEVMIEIHAVLSFVLRRQPCAIGLVPTVGRSAHRSIFWATRSIASAPPGKLTSVLASAGLTQMAWSCSSESTNSPAR